MSGDQAPAPAPDHTPVHQLDHMAPNPARPASSAPAHAYTACTTLASVHAFHAHPTPAPPAPAFAPSAPGYAPTPFSVWWQWQSY